MASDPDADGGAFEVPQVFAGVVETNPVVVTVDLDSADASHRSPALGARAAAAEPVDEVDGMKAGASSRPQAMTAMAISAGLCGLGWMRYRLYAQRRRWRRAAAKRRARRR
jgi:hypothetical protein